MKSFFKSSGGSARLPRRVGILCASSPLRPAAWGGRAATQRRAQRSAAPAPDRSRPLPAARSSGSWRAPPSCPGQCCPRSCCSCWASPLPPPPVSPFLRRRSAWARDPELLLPALSGADSPQGSLQARRPEGLHLRRARCPSLLAQTLLPRVGATCICLCLCLCAV